MNRELNLEAKTIHEAIEAQAAREGYKPKPTQPLTIPVLALPHTAIYKMHRYYARRPHNVFAKIIQQYTNPGDIVLDPFCGGGVTVVESLKLRRRVIGVDTNPLATWITGVEVEGVDFGALELYFDEWYGAFENDINDLYKAKCSKCGKFGLAEWYEWSNVVVCPICEKEVVLGAAKKLKAGVFECSTKTCKANINPNKCEKKPDTMLSVMVDCSKCGKKVVRKALPDDIKRYNQIVLNEKAIIRKNKLKIPKWIGLAMIIYLERALNTLKT
jgi:putative DNA methylase